MNRINNEYISSFIEDIIIDCDFLELRKFAEKENVPIMKLESKEFLKNLLAIKRPKSILEIGTAIGYSSLVFDKYSDAKITTIELSEDMAHIAQENFNKYNVDINLINDDAEKALTKLNQGFDFVFIDANKSNYKFYFDYIDKNLLNNGGVIVADNILFRGEVCNDDLVEKRKITIIKRLRNFLAYITRRDDYQTSIIPIGDGISVSVKEDK
ncbi:cobalt-precorrin-6Y C(15)-methyltransferase [Anaerococcus prevotii]|uniref:tRNA 5-hydroxyuridine methyltransferase n=1 Tax=Anaerococcus prevotii (strain ATCC 9321 / DSM 20548 / JCM 6508 / NCTC 11806 / PC1) TaxID=525919 RepID=C7RHK9_ANAPD|nr:O-methyltransferase [Anaerococcus prevotii]ACV28970.1 O-methyltransferase family 3 [Anaerococcus prevotii DSM 20548]SUU94643.1 cobalt-precorrin-6Y C(15)-methyltransferase [Anaerococcus prevotii]